MNSDNEKKITAVLIIEVLGRPAKHLTDTLEAIVKQIDGEKGVKVTNKKINEPHLAEEQKDLYASFAEVEIEVDDLLSIAGITFKYMPSHVEVVEPENIILKNHEFGEVLSEITRRLHQYEEVVKILQFQLEASNKGFPIQLKPSESPAEEERASQKKEDKPEEDSKKKGKK